MPTLQDVARHAGVSSATVSKVLSNTPYFTDQTRARVLSSVEALDYRPNLAARALANGRTHVMALIFPYVYEGISQDPLVMQILEGIERVCSAHQYNILLNTPRLSPGHADEHYVQMLRSGYIDGLIVIDSIVAASAAQPAIELGLPVISIGYHEATFSVRCDDELGGYTAMQSLLQAGHREIGIIAIPEHSNYAIDVRLCGVRRACHEAGIDAATLPFALGDYSHDSGQRAAETLQADAPHLTAYLCLNDRMAVGAIQALQRLGIAVPDDVSVIGYDNVPIARLSTPPLSTIDQRAVELGHIAATMLVELLDGSQPQSAVLAPHLILRDSTGQVTA